ncbi:MAG: protease modulator HflK, partial [Acidiferrobacterales bacterium]
KAREDEERFKNEAQAYSNDILPRARGNAARLVQEGEAYKASVIARSEGDARRFSQIAREYEKAPAITRERLYLESIESVLSNTTKVFIDQKGGNNILYLPLDKIVSQGRSGPSGQSSAEADSGAGSQSFGRGRSRNDLRTRGTE